MCPIFKLFKERKLCRSPQQAVLKYCPLMMVRSLGFCRMTSEQPHLLLGSDVLLSHFCMGQVQNALALQAPSRSISAELSSLLFVVTHDFAHLDLVSCCKLTP